MDAGLPSTNGSRQDALAAAELDALFDELGLDALINSALGVNCVVCGRRVIAWHPSRRKTCGDRCRKRLSRMRARATAA